MSITGAGTDCVQVLGVATLTMGHVACTDHMVWLAEAYRARYAAQPRSPCASVSLVAHVRQQVQHAASVYGDAAFTAMLQQQCDPSELQRFWGCLS